MKFVPLEAMKNDLLEGSKITLFYTIFFNFFNFFVQYLPNPACKILQNTFLEHYYLCRNKKEKKMVGHSVTECFMSHFQHFDAMKNGLFEGSKITLFFTFFQFFQLFWALSAKPGM